MSWKTCNPGANFHHIARLSTASSSSTVGDSLTPRATVYWLSVYDPSRQSKNRRRRRHAYAGSVDKFRTELKAYFAT
jgi:hypothetical protein